jgi:hypothetical protein
MQTSKIFPHGEIQISAMHKLQGRIFGEEGLPAMGLDFHYLVPYLYTTSLTIFLFLLFLLVLICI